MPATCFRPFGPGDSPNGKPGSAGAIGHAGETLQGSSSGLASLVGG